MQGTSDGFKLLNYYYQITGILNVARQKTEQQTTTQKLRRSNCRTYNAANMARCTI